MKFRRLLEISTRKKSYIRAVAEEVAERVADSLGNELDPSSEGLRVLDAGGIGREGAGSSFAFLGRIGGPMDRIAVNISHSAKPHVIADLNCHWPFQDESFDLVVSTWVLEHLAEPGVFCSESARVLKPNGILLVIVPFLQQKHGSPEDYFRYTDYALRRMLTRSGFQEVEVYPAGNGPFLVSASMLYSALRKAFVPLLPLVLFLLAKLADLALCRISTVLGKGTLTWKEHSFPLAYVVVGKK